MSLFNWTLADALNVYQIALLSAGYNPAEYDDWQQSSWPKQVKIETAAYLSTVKSAVLTGKIECEREYDQNDFDRDISWSDSLIDIKSYTGWLKERNHEDKFFNCSFFQPTESDLDRLLSPSGEYYAPKLAAAVRAWQAVTGNVDSIAGKSPKRGLEIWLRKHANEFGLTNKDGKPNEQGIEEACKVANWKPQGGASRTPVPPVSVKPTHSLPERGGKVVSEPPTHNSRDEMDEEIPF